MKFTKLIILVFVISFFLLPVMAADNANTSVLEELVNNDSEPLENFVFDATQKLLKDKLPFLSIRHIDNDNSGREDGYAVDYDWSRTFSNSKTMISARDSNASTKRLTFTSYDLELSAKGSYAWSDAVNNEDLSKIGVSARYMQSSSAWQDLARTSAMYQGCVTGTEPGPGADERIAACWLEFITPNESQGAFAYELGLDYNTEGNQDFTEKQLAYGAHIALSYEPARNSAIQRLNIFDYPFRWIRTVTNSPDFNASLPTVSLALEQVDPSDNSIRTTLADASSSFDRAHFTAAFSTGVGVVNGFPITFEWIYQRFYEADAPASVEAAGLDDFEFNKISLYVPLPLLGINLESEEVYLRYTSGSLPFDTSGEEAVVIGWQSSLSDLFGRN